MFFKSRNKKRGEDLNRKVEKFRRWWQDEPQNLSLERSNRSKGNKSTTRSFDSSFVYYEEG
ncbi:MAG: hypothetical protein AMJ91_00785 [candidate division Zixibacteria bacterium SM23_73_3]|nr:MAG: hypothetical protein AMJ91_00785 [candidate division Zixibacteria bacterium SM23_73_3]